MGITPSPRTAPLPAEVAPEQPDGHHLTRQDGGKHGRRDVAGGPDDLRSLAETGVRRLQGHWGRRAGCTGFLHDGRQRRNALPGVEGQLGGLLLPG